MGIDDGGKYLDSVYLSSVDAATWQESTVMLVACYYLGMAYVPAQDGSTKGQVMVVGGWVMVGRPWTLSTFQH